MDHSRISRLVCGPQLHANSYPRLSQYETPAFHCLACHQKPAPSEVQPANVFCFRTPSYTPFFKPRPFLPPSATFTQPLLSVIDNDNTRSCRLRSAGLFADSLVTVSWKYSPICASNSIDPRPSLVIQSAALFSTHSGTWLTLINITSKSLRQQPTANNTCELEGILGATIFLELKGGSDQ